MASSGPNDKTETVPTVLDEIKERFTNNQVDVICYPLGLAAYFTDQMLYHNADPSALVEEIRLNLIRQGDSQDPTNFTESLAVASDALIANAFYKLLSLEIKEAKIYDAETFFEFMQTNSPEALQLGVAGMELRGRFKPAKNHVPRDISL